ncbi:GNAT family N-acetyltransferase [Streptomyces sp. P38-E01]|uniref:GNAT family N-acetyltransferase n=1 Tax=Streptomyces tardus TaxID=2780544 RepID=A0A949N7N5_9ACTN|nr:GNAT family N-acetyltransferase [Streptomyces tardus]MBU7597153.1 GNAT family N-acetyltransferase [Streptomyces tardus]
MPDLQRLRPDHAPALLAFERRNRVYFAAAVPDRGDAWFAEFEARHAALLAEQERGLCHFHVLVGDGGEILGRVNLIDVDRREGTAELGYRIAQSAAGRGLATAGAHAVCSLAVESYGLNSLRAATTDDNPGSRTVLTRLGFAPVGATRFDGRPGTLFRLDLAPFAPR